MGKKKKFKGGKPAHRSSEQAIARLQTGGAIALVLLGVLVVGLIAVDFTWRVLPGNRISDTSHTLGEVALSESIETTPVAASAAKMDPDTQESWGYFRPVWRVDAPTIAEKLGISAPKPVENPETRLVEIIQDPDHRIDPAFKMPKELEKRGVFWMRVYTEIDQSMRLVHDREDLSLVYGVMDFRTVPIEGLNRIQVDILYRQHEKRILRELKARLSEASGLTKTNTLTSWERGEVSSFLSRAGAASKLNAQNLISRIRTQTGQRNEFLGALARSSTLLPFIESVLKNYGVPPALARLPFVESSFNPRANSKVGAVGIWQFMPETAAQMIHPTDRTKWADPLIQTRAAARFLLICRSLLPDWSTTVTAYNSGVGRLQRLVRSHKARSIVKIVESNDRTLGFAGKNFYAQFLTTNLIEAYKDKLFPELAHPEPDALASSKSFGAQRQQ